MKKICLCIPSLHAGGMERVMSELAIYFCATEKYEVHLLMYGGQREIFYEMPSNLVIHTPSFAFNNISKVWFTLKCLLFLRKKIKEIQPDTVLSFGEMYNSFVLLSSLGLNTNVFVSDRSNPNKDWGVLHNYLRKVLYKRACGIISQTSYSKKVLGEITHHKNIHVIPNPVFNKYESNQIKEKIILVVGRLITTKRVDVIINVFDDLKAENWKLWILGDGPERNNLEQLASKKKKSNSILFLGSKKEIGYFYSKSEICAMTSISEGFPNVLIEAQLYGLPTIAFDCSAGPSDIINDGENGFLIKEMDIESYRIKLQELIDNELLRESFSRNAKINVKNFSVAIIGNKYLDVLFNDL